MWRRRWPPSRRWGPLWTAPRRDVVVHGGRSRLHRPDAPLDCGNSGTSMRLLAGLVAGFDWDDRPGRRRVALGPAHGSRGRAPRADGSRPWRAAASAACRRCSVRGGGLHGIDWTSKVASAQVKSAIILAGLSAQRHHDRARGGDDPHPHRGDAGRGRRRPDGGALGRGSHCAGPCLVPPSRWSAPCPATPPHPPSSPWPDASCPGATSTLPASTTARLGSATSPSCSGWGPTSAWSPASPGDGDDPGAGRPLAATEVPASEIPSLDEIPVLGRRRSRRRGYDGVLRRRRAPGQGGRPPPAPWPTWSRPSAPAPPIDGDVLSITGIGGPLRAARFDSQGDHRMAMAAAVAAWRPRPGERSLITGFGAVETSYPAFAEDLAAPGRRARCARGRSVVAIDGPAGAGKSTVSTAVASDLGVDRLDTGAMYRAVAALALELGMPPSDNDAVAALAASSTIEVGERVTIDGHDVTGIIRSPEVGRAVSVVAANPDVRRHLVERQRAWVATHGGGVVEGRDIGSVVFPEAELKVYLTASPEERARRRHDEAPEGVARRDRLDSTRDAVAPARARRRPPARYHRAQRAGCGRGGAVVAVSTAGSSPDAEDGQGGRGTGAPPAVRDRPSPLGPLPGRAHALRHRSSGSGSGPRSSAGSTSPRPDQPFWPRCTGPSPTSVSPPSARSASSSS